MPEFRPVLKYVVFHAEFESKLRFAYNLQKIHIFIKVISLFFNIFYPPTQKRRACWTQPSLPLPAHQIANFR